MTPRVDAFEEFCAAMKGALNGFTAGVRGHNSGDLRFRPRMLLLLSLDQPLGTYLQQTIGGDPDTLADTGVCAWGRYLAGSSSLRLVSDALHRAGIPGGCGSLARSLEMHDHSLYPLVLVTAAGMTKAHVL